METPEWIAEGVCTSKPWLTYLFFSDQPGEQAEAKAMCHRCPVAAHCLVDAIRNNEKFGIFGGTSPADRRRLKASINL
jgi:WhiB family redox-sensing transcriptional regulator